MFSPVEVKEEDEPKSPALLPAASPSSLFDRVDSVLCLRLGPDPRCEPTIVETAPIDLTDVSVDSHCPAQKPKCCDSVIVIEIEDSASDNEPEPEPEPVSKERTDTEIVPTQSSGMDDSITTEVIQSAEFMHSAEDQGGTAHHAPVSDYDDDVTRNWVDDAEDEDVTLVNQEQMNEERMECEAKKEEDEDEDDARPRLEDDQVLQLIEKCDRCIRRKFCCYKDFDSLLSSDKCSNCRLSSSKCTYNGINVVKPKPARVIPRPPKRKEPEAEPEMFVEVLISSPSKAYESYWKDSDQLQHRRHEHKRRKETKRRERKPLQTDTDGSGASNELVIRPPQAIAVGQKLRQDAMALPLQSEVLTLLLLTRKAIRRCREGALQKSYVKRLRWCGLMMDSVHESLDLLDETVIHQRSSLSALRDLKRYVRSLTQLVYNFDARPDSESTDAQLLWRMFQSRIEFCEGFIDICLRRHGGSLQA
ncbi:hypothetical protein BCV70DRAFT_235606 [Testicularia cyperi]|uniref:Uncharacterized protein n=1 Tax=Testicularia cyperi TaxID=1882483 RepID=A0A317XUK5_9BASI|nr:hypothetical protein BCV70DRAFT_235606 [Testicularia cyperi]